MRDLVIFLGGFLYVASCIVLGAFIGLLLLDLTGCAARRPLPCHVRVVPGACDPHDEDCWTNVLIYPSGCDLRGKFIYDRVDDLNDDQKF